MEPREGRARRAEIVHERPVTGKPLHPALTQCVLSGDILAAAYGCRWQDHTGCFSHQKSPSITIQPEPEQISTRSSGWWAGPPGRVRLRGSSRAGRGPGASAVRWALGTDAILFVIISSTLPGGNRASEANVCAQDQRPVKIQPNRRGFEHSCGSSSGPLPSHHEAGANHLCVTEMC